MDNKARIKQYFEETIQTDPAIAAVYDESKLNDCMSYIMKMARKEIKGSSGFIEDSQVLKWARDFMLGDIAEEDKQKAKTEVKAEEKKTEIPASAETEEAEVQEEEVEEKTEEEPFEEVTSGEIHHVCRECGYYVRKADSDYGDCIRTHTTGVKVNNNACKEFINGGNHAEIEEIKNKLVIEKVEQEETPAPAPKKPAKKSKTADDGYDGPSLFDFDDLY